MLNQPINQNLNIFQKKNSTSEDRITINTGENDTNMIGVIDNINGKHKINVWGTDECNKYEIFIGLLLNIIQQFILTYQMLNL